MNQKRTLFSLVLTVAFSLGMLFNCLYAEPETPEYLIPLKVGNIWINDIEISMGDSLVQSFVDTTIITETKHWGGYTWVGPRGKRGQLMRNAVEGVWNLRVSKQYPKGAEFLIYPYPAEAGKTWNIDTMPSKLVSTTETVNVPAGEFTDCYLIEYNDEIGKSKASGWIKPGIGKVMVRAEMGEGARRTTYLHKLREYHLK